MMAPSKRSTSAWRSFWTCARIRWASGYRAESRISRVRCRFCARDGRSRVLRWRDKARKERTPEMRWIIARGSSRGRPSARGRGHTSNPSWLTSRSDVVDQILLGQLGGGVGCHSRYCEASRGGSTSTGRHGRRRSGVSRRANARAEGDRRHGGDVSCAGHLDRSHDTSRRARRVWSGSIPRAPRLVVLGVPHATGFRRQTASRVFRRVIARCA